jgi:hypothetical protein
VSSGRVQGDAPAMADNAQAMEQLYRLLEDRDWLYAEAGAGSPLVVKAWRRVLYLLTLVIDAVLGNPCFLDRASHSGLLLPADIFSCPSAANIDPKVLDYCVGEKLFTHLGDLRFCLDRIGFG